MFLVRVLFWIAVVAMLLPTAPDTSSTDGSALVASAPAARPLDAGNAINVATSTGSDVLGFCERNPAVCETAASAGLHVVNQVVYYSGEALSMATQALIDARQPKTPGVQQPQGV